MAKCPAMQLYFGDWKANQKLRFCSFGARGAWLEVMALMHDSDEYGVLRQSIKEIINAVGAPRALITELVNKGVMKGCASGLCEPYVFRPKHAGRLGDPVVLVPAQEGPIWYSSRMVRDEYIRQRRGEGTRFGDPPKESPKGGFGDSPKMQPNHAKGDGASTSSSSSYQIGDSSTSTQSEEARDAQARVVVGACIALKKLGMHDLHPQRPELLDLVSRGATVEQMALTAAELALKKAGMLNDTELHPELLERFASGATAEQMCLRPEQLATLKASAPNIGYLAATLKGRAEQSQGENYGNGTTGSVRGGTGSAAARRGPPESAAARAERKRREGDERDAASGPAYAE